MGAALSERQSIEEVYLTPTALVTVIVAIHGPPALTTCFRASIKPIVAIRQRQQQQQQPTTRYSYSIKYAV